MNEENGRDNVYFNRVDHIKCLQIVAQASLKKNEQKPILYEPAIFNYECTDHIGLPEIMHVVNHEQLSASVICLYMR